MRASQFGLLALVLPALTGCGTFHNLKDRPEGPIFAGTGACYPFGGVVRSGLLSVMGPTCGLGEAVSGSIAIGRGELDLGFKQVGHGMLMTSAGMGAIVDCPLSLAGDILTLPIAYGRSNGYRWATWWGGESACDLMALLGPFPEEGNKKTEGRIKPSD